MPPISSFKTTHWSVCSLICLFSVFAHIALGQQVLEKVEMDEDQIIQQLKLAPSQDARAKGISLPTIQLPKPDGGEASFALFGSPMLMDPNTPIRSYTGRSVEDPTCIIRVNVTPSGIYAIWHDQSGYTEVKPIDPLNGAFGYTVQKLDSADPSSIVCSQDGRSMTEGDILVQEDVEGDMLANACFQVGSQLRIFRVAIAVTWEYANLNGFTLNGVNTAIANRLAAVNLVYERDAAIRLVLISGNDVLTNIILGSTQGSDPFSNPDAFNTPLNIDEGADFINDNINSADFDIGHTFHEVTTSSASGLAGVGAACVNNVSTSSENSNLMPIRKAEGISTLFNNNTQNTLLIHEFGHMFGCRHTNYGCSTGGNCERFEPGQGTTIMSTSANCTANDVYQTFRDDFFSVESLYAINTLLATGTYRGVGFFSGVCQNISSGGGTCFTTSNTGNNPPVANANPTGQAYTIPKGTPFTLTGYATDSDVSDVLTYSWEQIDQDETGSTVPANTANSTTAPLFRVFSPSTSNSRTFPSLTNILSGNAPNATGETLPQVARSMNFAFLVRDNAAGGGGSACDVVSVTVTNDGPFQLTSQTTTTNLTGGQSLPITWDVAGTDAGSINCANVDILLSFDGGQTFPVTLASATANDGNESVTLPDGFSEQVRIKIACSDNIFFDLNDADLTLTNANACLAVRNEIFPNTTVTANTGDAALNLNLSPILVEETITNTVMDFNSSTPDLIQYSAQNIVDGACVTFNVGGGGTTQYDSIEFYVNTDANYQIELGTGGTRFWGIFEAATFNPLAVCNGSLVAGNLFFDPSDGGISFNSSLVFALQAGVKYVLAGYSLADTDNFTLNLNTLVGNDFYLSKDAGSDFGYTFAAVDIGTQTIKAISSTANFQNLTVGSYEVYGISFKSGGVTPPNNLAANTFLNQSLSEAVFNDGCLNLSTTQRALNVTCANEKRFDLTVFLQGPYDGTNLDMNTDIRVLSSFPAEEPYTDLSYTVSENPGACADPLMLEATSPTSLSLVDYVYVELRTSSDAASFVTSKVGLLRKDGTIANLDGSPFTICVASGNYFVLVRHRNHLGVMTQSTVSVP